MQADYAAAQELSADGCTERYIVAGAAPLGRQVEMPRSHVQPVPRGMVRVYGAATTVLKLLVRLLFVFPALIVVKAVLWGMGSVFSDYITVAFVLLVVATFAMLVLVMFLMLFVGTRSQRARGAVLAFRAPSPPPRGALPEAGFRISGRIDAGASLVRGEPVIVDAWGRRDGQMMRLFEARSFVVLPDGGAPTAVELLATPLVFAPYGPPPPLETAAMLAGYGVELEAGCVLRQGDRVELTAESAEPAARIEDARLAALLGEAAGGAGPYRGGESAASLVRSTAESPLVIRAE